MPGAAPFCRLHPTLAWASGPMAPPSDGPVSEEAAEGVAGLTLQRFSTRCEIEDCKTLCLELGALGLGGCRGPLVGAARFRRKPSPKGDQEPGKQTGA